MAIIVHIYYQGENGQAKRFMQEMLDKKLVEKIRQEKGNLQYSYFLPVEDEETVLLIDAWKDQQAIDEHHQSPMMAEIMELREKYDLHMKVERYITDPKGDLHDQAFIRQ